MFYIFIVFSINVSTKSHNQQPLTNHIQKN